MKENLTEYMQQNILSILINDDSKYKYILHNLKTNYFESSYYRKIYQRVKFYILRFKKAPKTHVYNLLDKDIRDNELYKEILDDLFAQEINSNYVVEEFNTFVRQQNLKLGVIAAAEHLEDGDLDAAEKELHKLKDNQVVSFDKGKHLNLDFLDEEAIETIPIGIKPLDDIGCCPTIGDMIALGALPGYGKSHFLTHAGKVALLTRHKVLHITLEMSENQQIQRYIQACFGISDKASESFVNVLKPNEYGYFEELDQEKIVYKLNLDDKSIGKKIKKKLDRIPLQNLLVKSFPSGHLSMMMLENYIESLIDYENFMPKLIMIDYPKKMKLSSKYLREELGETYIRLKGLADQYNTAVAVVAQFNREAKKGKDGKGNNVKWLDESYLQEDFSLINEVAWFMTFNQSQQEYENKLARIFVTKGRHGEKNLKLLLSQDYKCCQFALDAVKLNSRSPYKLKEDE